MKEGDKTDDGRTVVLADDIELNAIKRLRMGQARVGPNGEPLVPTPGKRDVIALLEAISPLAGSHLSSKKVQG